jgi:hypothetical protein
MDEFYSMMDEYHNIVDEDNEGWLLMVELRGQEQRAGPNSSPEFKIFNPFFTPQEAA